MIGRDGVIGIRDLVAGHGASPSKGEHGNGRWVGLNIGDGVIVEIERSTAGGIDATQVNVLNRDIVHFQAVIYTHRMVCDDAVAGINVRATFVNPASQSRVVAIQGHIVNDHVIGLDKDNVIATK